MALTAVTLLTSMGLYWQPTVSLLKWSRYSFTTFSKGPPLYSISNNTLFDVAIIDPQAETEKQQVKELLDGELDAKRNMRSTWTQRSRSRKDHYNDLEDRERRRPGRRARNAWQLELSSLRYAPFWPKFRELLMTWLANKRYEPKIMQKLVSTIKEPIDRHFHTESTGKYQNCAVVGNSGILLRRNYGEVIDAHQMVMRLNNARTAGFEKFVGEKTTIVFVNSNILHQCARRVRCFCQAYGEEVPIVMYVSQVAHLMDVVMCGAAHKAPLLVTDPRFDILSARIVRWYSVKEFVERTGKSISEWASAHDGDSFHYSSGMQAVMLALGLCEKVNLFGFGKSNETKHHYHTAQRRELDLHDYEAEYNFYNDLVNKRFQSIPFLPAAEIEIPPMQVFQ